MQSTGGLPSSASGGSAFNHLFSAILWDMLDTDPTTALMYVAVATVLSGFFFALVISSTIRYYRLWYKTDPLWIQIGVGFGTFISAPLMGLQFFQLHNMIYGVYTNITEAFWIDMMCIWTTTMVGGLYGLVILCYYSYRIYFMSGRKKWILIPLGLCVTATTAMMFATCIVGWRLPKIRPDTASRLTAYYDTFIQLGRSWMYVAFGIDITVSLSTVFFILYSKHSFLPSTADRGFLHRVVLIALESLVGALVLEVALCAMSFMDSATLGPMRIPQVLFGYMYYISLLYSLNCRQRVRALLDRQPIAACIIQSDDNRANKTSNTSSGSVDDTVTRVSHSIDEEAGKGGVYREEGVIGRGLGPAGQGHGHGSYSREDARSVGSQTRSNDSNGEKKSTWRSLRHSLGSANRLSLSPSRNGSGNRNRESAGFDDFGSEVCINIEQHQLNRLESGRRVMGDGKERW